MARRRTTQLTLRKQPQQARSTELVELILNAAIQVLTREGATRFTCARVAAKAGVSVGSLYQYFPNKAAILFRLQSDEWRSTSGLLQQILTDVRTPPLQRLRKLVRAFIVSECEEAPMRTALNDAAPLYRNAPEALKAKASIDSTLQIFMREAVPKISQADRKLAAELVMSTLSCVGKQFSEASRTVREIENYSDAMADMFCGYLASM